MQRCVANEHLSKCQVVVCSEPVHSINTTYVCGKVVDDCFCDKKKKQFEKVWFAGGVVCAIYLILFAICVDFQDSEK